MKAGKIVALVIGCLCAVLGFAVAAGAAVVGAAYLAQNEDGFTTTPTEQYESVGHALVAGPVDLFQDEDLPKRFSTENLGSILLRVTAKDPSRQVFVGIGPRDDVARYLDGVARTEVTAVEFGPFDPTYRQVTGSKTPEAPGAQPFWSMSSSGSGTQEIRWDLRSGSWTVVVMNADGSPGVVADIAAGARLEFLGPLALGLLLGAVILFVVGIPLVVVGAIGLGRHGPPQPHWPVVGPTGDTATAAPVPATTGEHYPAHLRGDLDESISRWKWLVKWLLAIPHYLVLIFLGIAMVVTTIIAGFAILFTGRYPRGLFDFNVGVLRWLWRVQFYAYSALGTDRYPPFTLQRTDYPADFDVEYPEQLSRGLVLVKWWLLSIPHFLILSVLTGGWFGWPFGIQRTEDGVSGSPWIFGSLLGILVVIAAVALLFTGRYPRSLFDFVMGINRWVYRVVTYVALMRDEYPPFRFDQGPREPHEPVEADRLAGPQ